MEFLEWDQAVRAAIFGGAFLVSLFAVLWVWYDSAGGVNGARWAWRGVLTLLVVACVPAVILGAANLDSDRETLFNIAAWAAIGATIVTLFGSAAYGFFGRETPDLTDWTAQSLSLEGNEMLTEVANRPAEPRPFFNDDATQHIRRSEPVAADAYFVAKSGRNKGQQFAIEGAKPAVLGRSSTDATIVIDDERVSGAHAQVRLVNGNFTFVDMNSTNGSFLLVEGRSEPIRQPQLLVDGDEIRVGHTVLAFVDTRKEGHR